MGTWVRFGWLLVVVYVAVELWWTVRDDSGRQPRSGYIQTEDASPPPLVPIGPPNGGMFTWAAKPVAPDPNVLGCRYVGGTERFEYTLDGNEGSAYRVETGGNYLIQFQGTYKLVRTDGSVQFTREQNMESVNRTSFTTVDADGLMEPDGKGKWKVWRAGKGKPKALRPPFPEENYGAGIVQISGKYFLVGSGKLFTLQRGHQVIPDINVFRDKSAYEKRTGRLTFRIFKCPEKNAD